jgi:hypothetical protein
VGFTDEAALCQLLRSFLLFRLLSIEKAVDWTIQFLSELVVQF